MAETIAGVPSITRFTIANADEAVRVDLTGKAAARASVQFEGSTGRLALTGTDGQILAGTDYIAIAADAPFTVFLGRDQSTTSIFVQSDNASTPCSVVVETAEGGR